MVIGNLEAQAAACVFALATAVGIYAVSENPIASVLFKYIQPCLTSQATLSYTITYRCAWVVDTPAGQRMLKGYKLLVASSSTWARQLHRACSCPSGIVKGMHIPLMNVTMDGNSTGNKVVMRQSQACPRDLGKAIVSAWLTTRVSQESSGYLVGPQGHAGLKASDLEFDT